MITPKEIQEQCLKWWKDVLLSSIDSCLYFPKEISRIGLHDFIISGLKLVFILY